MSAAARSPRNNTPQKRTRKQTLTDLRRAEILAAALKVFARKGFGNSRAEDVAAQAGIAKGTLYLYFASKEAIYEAAMAQAMQRLAALVEERLQSAGTVQQQVHIYVSARLEFWGREGELYRMVLTVGREKKQRRHTAAILQASVDRLVEILSEAIATGALPERPVEPIAWAVMDCIRGTLERKLDGQTQRSVEEDATLITEIALRYFQPALQPQSQASRAKATK